MGMMRLQVPQQALGSRGSVQENVCPHITSTNPFKKYCSSSSLSLDGAMNTAKDPEVLSEANLFSCRGFPTFPGSSWVPSRLCICYQSLNQQYHNPSGDSCLPGTHPCPESSNTPQRPSQPPFPAHSLPGLFPVGIGDIHHCRLTLGVHWGSKNRPWLEQ